MEGMDKTIRKYTNFDDMNADEYRYWQSRSVHERVTAVGQLAQEGYQLKGFKLDAFRLQGTLAHFERARRQVSRDGGVCGGDPCAAPCNPKTSTC
jgi:hypothetical protein